MTRRRQRAALVRSDEKTSARMCTSFLALIAAALLSAGAQTALELPPSVLQLIRADYVSEFGETRYFDAWTDLNGDGRNEIVVHVIGSMACGTGGCSTLIFTPEESGYRLVTTITVSRPPIGISPRATNGWKNLVVHVSGGGGKAHDAELAFDGRTYPRNPSVPPATHVSRADGIVVLIPDFESFEQGKIIK
jgi:hypothetical protein